MTAPRERKDGGGPAFPVGDLGRRDSMCAGMSLRDWFAGQAPEMPDVWYYANAADTPWATAMVQWRWFYADAMIAERAK